MRLSFNVIDPKTGEYPDCATIAQTEDWANNLVYCDIDGFAITEDDNLVLLDECGNVAYVPEDRFEITFSDTEPTNGVLKTIYETPESCPNCMEHLSLDWSFCPECGRPTDWSFQQKKNINLSDDNVISKLIRHASHAIGLDDKKPYTRYGKKFYKPYRNVYALPVNNEECDYWDVFVQHGCATAEWNESKTVVIYHLTRKGLDWLGKKLNITIRNEDN